MGDVSLEEARPQDGFTCPWCPAEILVDDNLDDARRAMESHLDGHFAVLIGRPRVTELPHATEPLAGAA